CGDLLGDERHATAATPRGEKGAVPARCPTSRTDQDIVGAEAAVNGDGLVARHHARRGVGSTRGGIRAAGCVRVEPPSHLVTDEELGLDLSSALEVGEGPPGILVPPSPGPPPRTA